MENQHYAGAYYLLGYAVECGFKACIARRTKRFDFPDRKGVTDSYTHDLQKLLTVSELHLEYQKDIQLDPQLAVNWAIVKEWSEETRYLTNISEAKAMTLYAAVTARRVGVLTWLKKWW